MNPEQIGIACNNPDALQEQALISEVSMVPVVQQDSYERYAITPNPQVHRMTQDDMLQFLATDSTPVDGLIEVIPISDHLRQHVAEHGQRLQPTVCEPKQLTTTENTVNHNLRPGLHVDSKENLPLETRAQSQRRIGLNKGPGARFLLIGSVSIFDIADYSLQPQDYTPSTGDVREYASLGQAGEAPPLRCLWLLLKPGTAYIAPTENIVHDGSTFGSKRGSTIDFWIGGPKERGELGTVW
ncbi:MAG TPA: hypothetical protein VLH38_00890 [Patescibacteria group bacterium]|jgi:hypothetical protein|nr:hypothetical protein [Patescibacteria group bacterium]